MKCSRCESVGRIPIMGTHKMIGPNGIKMVICTPCYKQVIEEQGDIEYFTTEYEDEEN